MSWEKPPTIRDYAPELFSPRKYPVDCDCCGQQFGWQRSDSVNLDIICLRCGPEQDEDIDNE